MPTMIRPKLTFATNNATATTQNARSLSGSNLPGRIDRLVKRTEDPLPPATTASGLRVPQVAAKEEGSVLYVRDRRLRGKMGCPGLAQRQQKTRFVRTA